MKKEIRKKRVRAKILARRSRLRLSVYRSNKSIYTQIIDDQSGKTLLSANEKEIKLEKKLTKIEKAKEVGKIIAQKALKKKIKTVAFDRGPYSYHGRVKALADGAREGGLDL